MPNSFEKYSPLLLRLGIAGLFVWFGMSQLFAPQDWVSWVPSWAAALLHADARLVVLLNGGFELIFAALLLLGFYTRIAALFLGLHTVAIAYEIGYDPVAIRDLCIATGCFSLALGRPDQWTLDGKAS